ncbi:MAG: hypothetical protein PSV36_00085 [Algoriphagus sp.]|nr:hypothetical protein [Algoriphagus sp.]
MITQTRQNFFQKHSAIFAGSLFLIGYWVFGFDGITFSDDVFYLLAGKNFWEGTMEVNEYHFSTRWGAYVPSGLIGHWLGFEPHRISLVSLISYLASLFLLYKILPKSFPEWILVLWFCTHVYFMHFLTKVYPDSSLVFWTCLVPAAAVYRSSKPYLSAFLFIFALFAGFLTKETIVFFAPLPILLFLFDWRSGSISTKFYVSLVSFGFLFGFSYLGYFWIEFGDPFYRITSIQAGHYISEFTYADKGIWSILKRLTYMPVVTFVERAYWPWLVFAVPGLLFAWKNRISPATEFALAFLSLFGCFWFMSTNLKFYNPLYLNPRHLIILTPILAFLVATGWSKWQSNWRLKRLMIGLLALGILISLFQQDWKMTAFQSGLAGLIFFRESHFRNLGFALFLTIPAIISIPYQRNLKQYSSLIEVLKQVTSSTENQSIIITNNFIDFSEKVLLPGNEKAQDMIFPMEKIKELQSNPPEQLRVLIYQYYQHAYPKEQVDVDALEIWLEEKYELKSENETGNVSVRNFRLKAISK